MSGVQVCRYTSAHAQVCRCVGEPGEQLQVSMCPGIHMSICPGVHVSTCPGVQVSMCPGVHVSRCPGV